MTDEFKPCPFGSKGKTEIEGKGQIWRGVKGYSDPQYFQLCHHGRLHDSDTFPTVFVEIRARTEEQAREMWNTRADLATPMRCAECDCEKGGADCNWIATPTPLDDPRVEALEERLLDTAASLAAAISLLERGGKKAAASDKMFAQMLVDYNASLDRARNTIAALEENK